MEGLQGADHVHSQKTICSGIVASINGGPVNQSRCLEQGTIVNQSHGSSLTISCLKINSTLGKPFSKDQCDRLISQ